MDIKKILLALIIILILFIVAILTVPTLSPLKNFGKLNELCSNAGMAIVDFDGGTNECYDIRTFKFYKLNCDYGKCFLEEDKEAMVTAPNIIKLAAKKFANEVENE